MALAVPSTDHAAGRIPKLAHFRKAYTKGIPSAVRVGGFPDRAARCLSLLLYSPAQDGKHIKCFPLRAELATNLNSGRPGPGIRRARWGNVPCQKGTGLFWSVLSGKTPLFTVIHIHLPRSSENQTNNFQSTRPYNAKKAASPLGKRPRPYE